VPVNFYTVLPVALARITMSMLLILSAMFIGLSAWVKDDPGRADHQKRSLSLLRLASLVVMAYLLFAVTVHPWYVTLIVPLLPFWLPAQGEDAHISRFLWPWLYFSCVVAISYSTYLQPGRFQEFEIVRLVEYVPLLMLLVWACSGVVKKPVK
jgi:hypothetical protein